MPEQTSRQGVHGAAIGTWTPESVDKSLESHWEGEYITGAEYLRLRERIGSDSLPSYQSVLGMATRKSQERPHTFYDAINIITDGRMNPPEGRPDFAPRRPKWSTEEILQSIRLYLNYAHAKQERPSIYGYGKFRSKVMSRGKKLKMPSASTITTLHGNIVELEQMLSEKLKQERAWEK